MPNAYDFSGMATAYDVLCGDGRIIKHGAFDWQAGQTVPMVWRHQHDSPTNYLGHGTLERSNSPSGIRVRAVFNSTTEGQHTKQMVQSGEIKRLSIWANELNEARLQHSAYGSVLAVEKGTIREFSLVRNGMNPGAIIDDVVIHGEDPYGEPMDIKDGVIIHTGEEIEIYVAEEDPPESEKEIEHEQQKEIAEEDPPDETKDVIFHADMTGIEILETLNDDQKALFNVILHASLSGGEVPVTGESNSSAEGPTMQEVFDSLTEEQEKLLYFMAGELSQDENLSQGDSEMPENNQTHRIFADGNNDTPSASFSHEDVSRALIEAAKTRSGSLKATFLQHSITNVSNLFPEAQNVDSGGPAYLSREMTWVEKVLGAASTRPFARIKSMYADLTPDAARAKGYVTAAQKVDEVIAVLKRVTTPVTVYKKQSLDRDDVVDITDFDVVVWLKAEMRLMLREELARAILISDGRSGADPEKIVETNVRPIYNDDPAYTISAIYNDIGNEQALSAFTASEVVAFVDWVASQMQYYRGSGQPTFYCQPEVLTKLLLVRDSNNQRLHRSVAELAEALRVSAIVDVPPMSGMGRTGIVDPTGLPVGTYNIDTLGVIVNLKDYVIGMDRGGETNFFDDFDIDYNKLKYLYETRLAGAMVRPLSAIAIELVIAKTA